MSASVVARIDRDALAANLRLIRKIAPAARVMAVVKSDAYGHGLLEVARCLAADAFAVARVAEAVTLREGGIEAPVCVLSALLTHEELEQATRLSLDLVVQSQAQLERVETLGDDKRLRLWLKLNTGMNRLGFAAEEFPGVLRRVQSRRSLRLLGLMTHLACADDLDDPATNRQVAAIRRLVPDGGLELSIANSAGLIGWPQSLAEWVRPGIMLYGISPFGLERDLRVAALLRQLRPAMRLQAPILAIQAVAAGESVGYGARWTAARDSRIAVIGIGYGDGYPRQMAQGAPVWIAGRRYPLVGRVCMDMICVDVTDAPSSMEGETAVLWGPELPVEEVAQQAGTLGYSLVSGLTARVRREYLGGP